MIDKMKEKLFAKREILQDFEPLRTYDFAGNQNDIEAGDKLISAGKTGCLILAGGQGTRMNLSVPKALVNVSVAKSKSLLQLFCEKSVAASKRAKRPLKMALMTSPLNHKEIESYLQQNQYFGLQEGQLFLFSQGMLPFLDPRGNPLLQPSGHFAEGPDGNGGALKAFLHSGIWEKWRQEGVEYLNIVLIDNPLADPFDANLIGYHAKRELEVTLKAVLRETEEEKVGMIVQKRNQVRVIEYSDFPEELKYEKNAQGSFVWKLANISLFCFGMEFIKQIMQHELPWHFCQKTVDLDLLTDKGFSKERALVWKCESYIFDHLAFAQAVNVLLYARNETYSALKNLEGENSVESVRKALLAQDRRRFFQVSGRVADHHFFELDQAFHYPTKQLLKKWKGKALPKASYIES